MIIIYEDEKNIKNISKILQINIPKINIQTIFQKYPFLMPVKNPNNCVIECLHSFLKVNKCQQLGRVL